MDILNSLISEDRAMIATAIANQGCYGKFHNSLYNKALALLLKYWEQQETVKRIMSFTY